MTLRILHILPSYLPAVRYGGPTFAVHGLCRALAARGHHVEVFTTNINGVEDSAVPLGIPVSLDGVQVTYFPSRILRRLFWSPPLARALCRDVASFSVVHLHSVFLWPTWAAARSARQVGVPYVMSLHGMLVKDLIRRRSRLAKSMWIDLIEKTNLMNASAIHVTSELEAHELHRFGWELPRIEIIPNGVDEITHSMGAQISVDVAEIAALQPFVLFLGRMSWKKGLDRLLSAFAATNLPRLVIVGPNDENILPQLVQAARNLNIADRVAFLPRTVLGADKEHLYASARMFVLPSYSENFGITVLEAMQRGLPVIVTPEVGAASIVREAKAGLIVPGDPETLGAAMRDLAETEGLAQMLGEAGRGYVAENYNWSRVAAQIEELYARLLADSDAMHMRSDALC